VKPKEQRLPLANLQHFVRATHRDRGAAAARKHTQAAAVAAVAIHFVDILIGLASVYFGVCVSVN